MPRPTFDIKTLYIILIEVEKLGIIEHINYIGDNVFEISVDGSEFLSGECYTGVFELKDGVVNCREKKNMGMY